VGGYGRPFTAPAPVRARGQGPDSVFCHRQGVLEVGDLEAALEGQKVICPPGSPSEGVRAAMIVDNGALVELIWFRKNSDVHKA
jgi:hypothetical protein